MRFTPSRSLAIAGSIFVASVALGAPAQADDGFFSAQLDDVTIGAHGASPKVYPL